MRDSQQTQVFASREAARNTPSPVIDKQLGLIWHLRESVGVSPEVVKTWRGINLFVRAWIVGSRERVTKGVSWMEPAVARRRDSKSVFASICPRLLIAWLDSPCGQPLREAIEEALLPNLAARLFDGSEESKALQAEVLERADKTTRCIVVASGMENGNVFLECYGPRELQVKIVTLPKIPLTPECLAMSEKLVEVELPKAYRPYFYPGMLRQREVVEVVDVEEWSAREKRKMADVQFSKALETK